MRHKLFLSATFVILCLATKTTGAFAATINPTTETCVSVDRARSNRGLHRMYFDTNHTVGATSTTYLQMCYHVPSQEPVCAPFGTDGAGREVTRENIVGLCIARVAGYPKLSAAERKVIREQCENDATDKMLAIQNITKNMRKFHYIKDQSGNTLTQPLKPGTQIKGVEWSDYTKSEITRTWHLVEIATGPSVQLTAYPASTDGGLQHGTQGFIPNCSGITYDPYGMTFDAGSGLAVNGAKVVLYHEEKSSYRLISGLEEAPTEGYISEGAGNFTFLVPVGNYKLEVLPVNFKNPPILEGPMLNSLLETDTSRIRGYNKATNTVVADIEGSQVTVYKNIYPLSKDIYPPIRVTADGAQVDLPIKTGIFKPVINVQVAELYPVYGYGIRVTGRVSQPYSPVYVYAKNQKDSESKIVATTRSDGNGDYNILVASASIPQGSIISDLKTTSFADLSHKTLSPPFVVDGDIWHGEVLESTSRNSEGDVLPKVDVLVYKKGFKEPYYRTTSNSIGEYRIDKKFLPDSAFELEYADPQSGNILARSRPGAAERGIKSNTPSNNVDKNTTKEIKPDSVTSTKMLLWILLGVLVVLFATTVIVIIKNAKVKSKKV